MNNIAYQNIGKIYGIESDLPSSVQIEFNLLWRSSWRDDRVQAGLRLHKQHDDVAVLGYDRAGIFGDPKFVNAGTRDYHLTSSAPARDRGTWSVGGFTAFPVIGANSDIGRWEFYP